MSKAVAIAATASAARRVRWVMIGMLMTLLAAVSLSAWSQPAPPPPASGPDVAVPQRGDRGPGMGGMHGGGERHGMGGRHHGMDGGMMFRGSPEHMGRMIDHMLDGLNASDAQRTQIKQIAQAAAVDLKAQHEAGKALHERSLQIFAAPTVDANAAESVRQQIQAQHDQASRRVLQAMLDVSRVLTPEQRAAIAARIKQHQATMQDRMQRMHRESGQRDAVPKPQ
jgi:Spy/CpxP family protein refolding chaperone